MLTLAKLHTLRALSLATGSAFTFGFFCCAYYCAIAGASAYQHGTERIRAAYAYDSLHYDIATGYLPTDAQALTFLAIAYAIGFGGSLFATCYSVQAFARPIARARSRYNYTRHYAAFVQRMRSAGAI